MKPITLSIIQEGTGKKLTKRKLEKELIKKFKDHLVNKDFFARLKVIMYSLDKELQMTRNGGSVTDEYSLMWRTKGNKEADWVRKEITFNTDFT